MRQTIQELRAAGKSVVTDATTTSLAETDLPVFADEAALAQHCDLLIAVGGDGTMLRVARTTVGAPRPILGVNVGRLGFLTACSSHELPTVLPALWRGECLVEARQLVAAQSADGGDKGPELALNDFVISRGEVPRLIELEVRVNGDLLTCYRGDGLIISSPTGSTAYSLAAGGAVVSPQAEVFALTPICPHTLSSRSVIVPLSAKILVTLRSEGVQTLLAADGQVRAYLETGDCLRFERSRHAAQLVRLPGRSFFDTLRQKLSWSGSTV